MDYDQDGITDLVGIKADPDNFMTLNVMSGASNYTSSLSIKTTLWAGGSYKLADYNGDQKRDLWLIAHNGSASGKTELHIVNAEGGYQNLIQQAATPLGLIYNQPNHAFVLGDIDNDSKADLWFIKSREDNNTTEIHAMCAANNFQNYCLQKVIPLPANTGNWSYSSTDYNNDGYFDLVAVNRNGNSGKTEVTILNGIDGFQSQLLFQITNMNSVSNSTIFVADNYPTYMNNFRLDLGNDISMDLVSENHLLNVYPNPSNGHVNIDFSKHIGQSVKIQIINSLGTVVHTESIDKAGSLYQLNLVKLEGGFYSLLIDTDNSGSFTKGIMIIK